MFFVCRNISIFALINGFLCIYAVLHSSGFIFAAFPPLLTRTSVRSILQQKACLPHLYGWYTQTAHSSQRSFLLHHSFESFLFDFRHVVEKLTYAISRDIPAQHPVRCLCARCSHAARRMRCAKPASVWLSAASSAACSAATHFFRIFSTSARSTTFTGPWLSAMEYALAASSMYTARV